MRRTSARDVRFRHLGPEKQIVVPGARPLREEAARLRRPAQRLYLLLRTEGPAEASRNQKGNLLHRDRSLSDLPVHPESSYDIHPDQKAPAGTHTHLEGGENHHPKILGAALPAENDVVVPGRGPADDGHA